jgi:preprotein translocase subunit YajC
MLFGFILIMVVMKFTASRIEDTPAKCREKMARSMDAPA